MGALRHSEKEKRTRHVAYEWQVSSDLANAVRASEWQNSEATGALDAHVTPPQEAETVVQADVVLRVVVALCHCALVRALRESDRSS